MLQGERITVQNIRRCQPAFSAALTGHVEAAYSDEAEKNDICRPIPHPDTDLHWLPLMLTDAINSARWSADRALGAWLQKSRLDAYTTVQFDGAPSAEQVAVFANIGKYTPQAIENLRRLMAQAQG